MPFPLSAEKIAVQMPIVSLQKTAVLDEILPELISRRVMIEGSVLDSRKRKPVSIAITGIIVEKLNPKILEIIFSHDALYFHISPPEKKWHQAISNDQRIECSLRDLIKLAYGDDIHNDIVRKKITGCRNAILVYVNSQDFYDQLKRSAPAADIKDLKFRKNHIQKIDAW